MVSAILLGPRRAPLGAPIADVFGTGPCFSRLKAGLNSVSSSVS